MGCACWSTAASASTEQFQAIPPARRQPAAPGGVIALGRNYAGIDLRWTARSQLAGTPLDVVARASPTTRSAKQRQGYENFIGAHRHPRWACRARCGATSTTTCATSTSTCRRRGSSPTRWTLDAGVRHSSVRFESHDHYIVGPNRDDSGSVRYSPRAAGGRR